MADPEQLVKAFTYCRDFAKRMLEEAGEFHPFGASLTGDGKVHPVGAWNGEEHPKAGEIYQMLLDAFRENAAKGAISGAAVAVNVNIPSAFDSPWPDGVRVLLEAEGYSRFLYIPYAIKFSGIIRRKREISFAEPFSVEVKPAIFSTG